MARTKGHYDYDERMFTKLGVHKSFYEDFIRFMCMKLKGNKCQECAATKDLHLHHTDLKLINIDTLHLLCRKCHNKRHKK